MDRVTRIALGRGLVAVAFLLMLAAPGATQPPPAESCDGTQHLDGTAMVPQSLSLVPQSDDFNMTGTNCVELGFDHVTCFVPENSCSVNIACETSARGGATVGINVLGGPTRTSADRGPGSCNQAPSSCSDSNSANGTASLLNVSLLAGVEYCVVCEIGPSFDLDLNITANTGNCGSLPVTLQSFSVDAAEDDQ